MAQAVRLPSGKIAQVAIKSLLVPAPLLKEETIDAIRNATETMCLEKAVELWGESQRLTIRDLNATDMSYTNNIFTETSNASANAWNAMAFGAFTVATSTVIGIYGIIIGTVPDGTIDFPPISGIRIDVGGARVAQWHVQSLHSFTSGASTSPLIPAIYGGFTKSPVVVGEDMTVTIYEYTQTASTAYYPIWQGVTVEKEGVTLRP